MLDLTIAVFKIRHSQTLKNSIYKVNIQQQNAKPLISFLVSCIFDVHRSRVVNLRLDKAGRAGRKFKWTGPVRPEFQLGRALTARNLAGPGPYGQKCG